MKNRYLDYTASSNSELVLSLEREARTFEADAERMSGPNASFLGGGGAIYSGLLFAADRPLLGGVLGVATVGLLGLFGLSAGRNQRDAAELYRVASVLRRRT